MYLRPTATNPPPQTLSELPSGKSGTIATLKIMRQLARAGTKHPSVRAQAEALITGLPHKAYAQQARELFEFVRDDIQYVRDPVDVERIQTPDALLISRKGDCDDKVVLLAALLRSIGHPVQFVAVGLYGGPLSHVFLETRIGAQWVACESTEMWPMGKAPKVGVTSRYVMEI